MPAAPHERSASCHDPLLAYEPMPFAMECYALGFRVKLQSNDDRLLKIARASWPAVEGIHSSASVSVQIGVRESNETACPQAPVLRAHGHIMTSVCDAENFITCDLQAGRAFGWVTSSVLAYPEFLRYYVIEATMMTLLTCKYLTPLHAAFVSYAGRGILLHGCSGAGKSTLSYACARAGWTYTTDDASYLLRDTDELRVRGRCTQFRFRPSARELFPEVGGRSVTPRAEGKPSIEIPSNELAVLTAPEQLVYAFVDLDRTSKPNTSISRLSPSKAMTYLEESLFPLPFVREQQQPTLHRLAGIRMFTLHYRDLAPAIEVLEGIAEGRLG